MDSPSRDHEKKIQKLMEGFVRDYGSRPSVRSPWKKPLVAIADASDPLFEELKRAVSPTHLMPHDLLPGSTCVITFFIPFDRSIPRSNRGGSFSSKEWAHAYVETNALIADLGQYLAGKIEEAGHRAATLPATHNYDPITLTSDWSHKHVAYIAGLGDFGLHHLLITEKGCCGRLGSLVTTLPLRSTPRRERPFCLYRLNRSCLRCVSNCVFGALRETAYDRQRCSDICSENDRYHHELSSTAICGKCACTVPCSFTNPVGEQQRRRG